VCLRDERFPGLAKAVREAARSPSILPRRGNRSEPIHERSTVDAETTTTIAETRPASSLAKILDEWRAVERRLAEAPAGSSEAADLIESSSVFGHATLTR